MKINKRKIILIFVVSLLGVIFFIKIRTPKVNHALYNGITAFNILDMKPYHVDLVLNENFENGKNEKINFERDNNKSISYVMDPFSEKNTVLKLTLHPGDTVNNGHRVEITNNNEQSPGDEFIYAYKFLLDRNYNESDLWQGIMQFHDQPDFSNGETWESYGKINTKLYPPIMMNYSNGQVHIVKNDKDIQGEPLVSAPIVKDAWNTVVIHIKNGYEDGFFNLFLNGENITKGVISGQTIYNDEGNYIKIGLYRDPSITTSDTIYIDDFSVYKVD